MVDQDLETLFKQPTFHIRGRDVPYRELNVEEALLAEYRGQAIYDELNEEFEESQRPVKGKRQKKKVDEPRPEDLLKIIAKRIRDYMSTVLELTPEETESLTLDEFRRFRREKEDQELRDQGFNDQEIMELKKEAARKNFRDALGDTPVASSTSTN